MSKERAYWLAWSGVRGVGPILLKRIYEHFGSLSIAWSASESALRQVQGIGLNLAETIATQRSQRHPQQLLEQQTSNFWTPADAAYPKLLFTIADPPPLLYYRGRPELIQQLDNGFSVGIVGTRSPTEYGRRWTRQLAGQFARQQWVVVSGLAEGIDRIAHQSALEVSGATIGVLGTGVDRIYPLSNRSLYGQIAQKGLLVSEYPNGTPPDRAHFPQRNRIIAGLSRAVLVTEAPARSGALITARLANDYGREVYALPGGLDDAHSAGCLNLISQGAQMVLGIEALMESLGALPSAALPVTPPNLDPQLETIYQGVPREPISLDNLVSALALETGTVLSALVQLELIGLVIQLPGMRYRRCG